MFGARKRIEKLVSDNFGRNPLEGSLYYDAGRRMSDVERLHKVMEESGDKNSLTDDVTWNDLEMDQVFLRINHTNSFIGEQTLYHRLHDMSKNNDEHCDKMEARLAYLKDKPEKRSDIEVQLNFIGKSKEGYYLIEFLQNTELWKLGNTVLYHTLQILLLIFLAGTIIYDNAIWVFGLICIASVNLLIYNSSKQKYEIYLNSLGTFKGIYDFAKWMKKKVNENDLFVSEDVKQALTKLSKMSRVIVGMSGRMQSTMTGDAMSILADYVWGVMLLDVSMFNHIMKVIKDKQEEVMTLLNFTGGIDSEIAILSYRKSIDEWCIPEFVEAGMEAYGLAHPLLNNPVKNDFKLDNRAIITGANASGKSTFMKTVAINCILAQTIHTCTASKMYMAKMQVMTCMSLRDDILSGESYYFREAKYLKRMLDVIVEKERVLIVIDEILKGTNTKERVAASKAILDYIGTTDCLALVATHDNELTETTKYMKYYFESSIIDGDIVFDYKIHDGIAEKSNAIALLSLLGYPDIIIEKAKVNINENR